MKIKIITHTGSDLPLEEAKSLGVTIIPDLVIFGNTTYRNMFDLAPDAFYNKLKNESLFPKSSHPPVGEIARVFEEAAKDADEILFISITSKMSGTFSAAITAACTAKSAGVSVPIYVYDTLQCSHAMAEITREAVRLAEKGLSSAEIIKALDIYREKMGLYFILDTLQYAKKGGRVGLIKALAADTLNIKPLMVFDNGNVRDIGIARGFDDGLQKVADKYREEADFSLPVTIFHLQAPNRAVVLRDKVLEINPSASIRIEYVGPVIGIYAGPGGAGLAFTKK